MKSTSLALLLAAFAAADPMVYTAPDGTTSAHLSGGLLHNLDSHDEGCEDGVVVDCQVEEGWQYGACSTTCGQGTKTRSRAVTVEVPRIPSLASPPSNSLHDMPRASPGSLATVATFARRPVRRTNGMRAFELAS